MYGTPVLLNGRERVALTISYDRLWLRLRERDMSGKDLQELAGISSKTLARLRKNQTVKTSTLEKICAALSCDLPEIVNHGRLSTESQKQPSLNDRFTIASFFAGIGGFDIGFERHGFKTDYLCEIDEFCNSVLSRHWPDVPRGSDINQVSPEDIPDVDVWVGGFPCQDISLARGRLGRPGLKGDRSGLFYRFAELLEIKQPKVVLLENVAGLLNSNQGRDFGVILQRLTKLGYTVSWRMMNTRYFGAPQSRTRVYICGWKGDSEKALRTMFEAEKVEKPKNERRDFIEPGVPTGTYPITPKVAYCLAATSGRHTGTDWSRTYVVCSEGVRRLTPLECERIQGFPDRWSLPSAAMQHANDEIDIDTLRYTALGNAVSVPVVEWIAERAAAQLNSLESSVLTYDEIQLAVPGFEKSMWRHNYLDNTDFIGSDILIKWPKAGIAMEGSYIGHNIPPSPATPVTTNLSDLVENKPVRSRYYLTPNAAEGIIRRVTRQGRSLFPPLHEALDKLRTQSSAHTEGEEKIGAGSELGTVLDRFADQAKEINKAAV